MKLKSLIAILGMAQLATGCILVSNGGRNPPPAPGDVTFTWSFVGRGCAENPDIKSVVVTIPGETLQNGGVFPCTANNYPGIVLHDFAAGTYSYTLEAVSYSNKVLFGASGSFTVNGDIRVTADLTPAGGPTSYAYLTWRFPPNSASQDPGCSQAGVTRVEISIDGQTPPGSFACEDGFTMQGVQTPYLTPGTHQIEFLGLSSSGYPYYRYTGTLQTQNGNPVYAEYRLAWNVGGAAIKWQLTDGSIGRDCTSGGVSSMSINFQDASGNWVYGNSGDNQACNAAPVVYNYLLPGTYRVFIRGTGPGGTYLSNGATPPTLTVRAGEFVSADAALTVTMYRQ